ncbi:hypothetical protein AAE478_004066 [Parahypoxylon ruwenzoriense]
MGPVLIAVPAGGYHCLSSLSADKGMISPRRSIFYQRNYFVILPKGGRLNDLESCDMTHSMLMDFFRKLPPNAAPLLRSMGLAVPPLNLELVVEGGQLLAEWETTFTFLLTKCAATKLSLTLFISLSDGIRRGPPYQPMPW